MSALTTEISAAVPEYSGVRMTADEFYSLPDDGFRYELVDGVVIAAPSPSPAHQNVAGEVFHQLKSFLKASKVGVAYYEVDGHSLRKFATLSIEPGSTLHTDGWSAYRTVAKAG